MALHTRLQISVVMLCLFCNILQGQAATYYLDPASGTDGNPGTQASPWKTMVKAKTTVAAGDTVNIVGGTYTPAQYKGESGVPNWTSAQSLGTAGNPITIQAAPGATVIFDGQFDTYWQRFYATASYGGHYVVVKNLTFKNYAGAGLGVEGASSSTPAHHVAVIGCTLQDFSDNQTGALSTSSAHHVIFRGNTIKNIGNPTFGGQGIPRSQHAVYISENSQYVVGESNYMEKISGYGFHNWGHGNFSVTTQNIIMRTNTIVNTYASSIIIAGTNYANMYAYNNTFYGEQVPFPELGTTNGDTFVSFHNGGVYNNIHITNNIGYGYLNTAPFQQDDHTQFAALAVDYNLWTNLTTSTQIALWDGTYYTLAGYQAVASQDAHAISVDPRFVNAATRDFTLQSTSQAIDAGSPMLTTTVGSGSGTTLTVADAGFFMDGFGLVAGDMIQVGAFTRPISAVNYATNTLTLVSPLTWTSGQRVSLPYNGTAPDIGAFETGSSAPPPVFGTYFLSPTGSDTNTCAAAQGTLAVPSTMPKRTLASVLPCMSGGSTLYMRAGGYSEALDTSITPIPTGTSWALATLIAAYPGETVTIQNPGSANVLLWLQNPTTDHYIIFDGLHLDGNSVASGLGFTTYPGVDHIRFQNGEIKNTSYETVLIYQANAIEILTSQIHNGSSLAAIAIGGSTDSVIRGNTIFAAVPEGIGPKNGLTNINLEISRNQVYNTGTSTATAAIVIAQSSNGIVMNNIVYGNNSGINVQNGASGQRLYNNTVTGNTNAGILIDSGASNTLVKNDIVFNNGSAITDNGSGTIQATNKLTDPLFVNAAGNNYQLQSASTARDTGTTLTDVLVDFAGVSRPQGIAYDIGAYEFPVTAIPHIPTGLMVMF